MTASLHFRLARPMAALLLAMVSVHPASYPSAVLSDSPLAYYRFDDPAPTPNINQNRGSLGTLGNATNINVRPVAGAIAGSRNPAAYFDSTARAIIP